MAIAIRFVGSSDDAALTADLGRQAADQGDWTRASQLFDQAFAADPDIPLYRMESSIGLALAGREGEAAERLAPAAAIEGSSISLLSLAWYQAAAGQTDASLASARLAWARGTGDPLVALNVGALAARGGAAELSVEAYGEAIYLAPALAASAYFTSLPIRDAVITKAMELVAAARSSGGSISRALILAYTGNLDEAQAELDRVPAGADRISVQATLDWLGGRRSEAINGLRTALDADPANGGIALQLAQLLAANGDPASARYFDWARLVGVGSVASTTVSGLGVTTAGEANDSGYPSNYPWMLYVRYGPLLLSAPDYLVVR
jgi:tetratricopeptide (TPR) repeat protein